ncbi:MAG: TIGR02147 family protein, partial [Gammaproteobacteria bacterium]|nr:TIGR02147 family protein [Gammaproteobacteria bacterium]
TTGDEFRTLAIRNFHQQNLDIANKAMDQTQAEKRDISSLVLGLSSEGFSKVKWEIQAFRKKLLDIAESDKKMTGVYHVNFQLFPTSKDIS